MGTNVTVAWALVSTPDLRWDAPMPVMDAAAITEFIAREFPSSLRFGAEITEVKDGEVRVRLPYREGMLRPGGSISGPTMMTLADVAMWVLCLSQTGPEAMTVTASLNISFLRRPAPADLWAVAKRLKHGRHLSVGEVHLYSEGEDDPVAHAQVTYSIPRPKAATR